MNHLSLSPLAPSLGFPFRLARDGVLDICYGAFTNSPPDFKDNAVTGRPTIYSVPDSLLLFSTTPLLDLTIETSSLQTPPRVF